MVELTLASRRKQRWTPWTCSRCTLLVGALFVRLLDACAGEDLAVSAPYNYPAIMSDEPGAETTTSANINVTWEEDGVWKTNKSVTGRYGSGYVGAASGLLVHVASVKSDDDHTGCHLPLRNSARPDGVLPREPWIALVRRGGCNFEDKVANAYKSRAVGVIVYNDRDAKALDKMKLQLGNGRNISGVFTYKAIGEEMAKLVSNNTKVLVHITIASHTLTRTTINKTSVLFVSITFIVLMIISIAWLVFYYVQRFRYIHAKDRLEKRLFNAAKKALSKIPTKNIKAGDKELQGDGECCAICIEPYRVPEVLRMLPCSHEFHKNCIDPWLLEHRTCPMCKMDILKHYGFAVSPNFTGSQESILHMEAEEVVALDGGGGGGGGDLRHEHEGGGGGGPARRNAGGGGISPLPQIRAGIDDNQRFDSDQHSSRSSSPNEMTPSLPNRQMLPVRQDLCVTCIAAAKIKVKRDGIMHPPHPTTTTAAVSEPMATSATTTNVCHIDYDDEDDDQEAAAMAGGAGMHRSA